MDDSIGWFIHLEFSHSFQDWWNVHVIPEVVHPGRFGVTLTVDTLVPSRW